LRSGQRTLVLTAIAFAALFFFAVPFLLASAAAALGKEVVFTLNFDRSLVFLLLMLGFFAIKNRKALAGLEAGGRAWWEPLFFGAFSALAFSWYFAARYLLSANFVLANFGAVVLASYAAYLLGCAALWAAVFGIGFSASFARRFSKELVLALIAALFFIEFSLLLQFEWKLFSSALTAAVHWLLAASAPQAMMELGGMAPVVGAAGFTVIIGAACSGIDSIGLFTVLFLGILAYDWKSIDKWRAAAAFVPGVVLAWFADVLRIYFLVLVGAFVSPALAIGFFHENAGWFLFVIFCTAYWYFAYPFMRAGKRRGRNRGEKAGRRGLK